MAKKKDENASADRDAQTTVGGVTPSLLKKTISQVDEIKAQLSELQGDLGSTIKKFDDQGGNKKAMNWTRFLINLESNKAKDFWTCLLEYMDEMGVFAQHELFDPRDQNANAKKPEAASPVVAATMTGKAQGDAFAAAHGGH